MRVLGLPVCFSVFGLRGVWPHYPVLVPTTGLVNEVSTGVGFSTGSSEIRAGFWDIRYIVQSFCGYKGDSITVIVDETEL